MAESSDDPTVTVGFDMLAAFGKPAKSADLRIPGYTIVGELARGGMGAVYHARQIRPEREVALKVMLSQLAEVPEMQARFQIEARAMAALDHPGILPVYEVGDAEGVPFFSMKLVSGGTLAQRLKVGPMAPREAAALLLQIARAVHFAHQRGTLHRDLKPANFLFDEAGRAYVSDFGLAKLSLGAGGGGLTQTESFLGTPHYMPPEVAGGASPGCTMAGDLYSLGAVLYECLCGRRPHGKHEMVGQLLRAIVDEPVPPPRTIRPEVPRDLEIICMKALEKSPADRYASVGEFADDLERWLDGRPIAARPVGVAERLWSWGRRHPLPAALATILVVTTSIGSVVLAVSHRERGLALLDARQQLRRSLIDQARSERLLKSPGHRGAALGLLRQAADIGISQEIRDEVVSLLAQGDVARMEGGPKLPAASLPPWGDGDSISNSQISPDGGWTLAFHESGRASLGRTGATQPERLLIPIEGRAVKGSFAAHGNRLVLAEMTNGTVITSLNGEAPPRVLQEPGSIVTFLQTDGEGKRVAIGRADGFEAVDLSTGERLWRTGPGPVRCVPAWSPDGTQVAAVLGETRGFSLFDAATGQVQCMQQTVGWPVQLQFHPAGGLACVTDEPAVLLCDRLDGRVRTSIPVAAQSLRFSEDGSTFTTIDPSGRFHGWRLENPVGFREWNHMPQAETDGKVFKIALSRDGRFLLTAATAGIRIWSVAEERQTGFHAVENQRIDAHTGAWWLRGDEMEILVQVPGGLERVPIDSSGHPKTPIRVDRQPGTTVIDVTDDGTWLVTSLDPEAPPCEAWLGGDSKTARAVPLPVKAENVTPSRDGRRSARVLDQDVIQYSSTGEGAPWRLIPPERLGIRGCVFSRDGNRLFVLGHEHRLFVWEVGKLREELALRKFDGAK